MSNLNNFQIIGERGVLVKVFEVEKKKDSPIETPIFRANLTDGGRPTSEIDEFESSWMRRGEILYVSPEAQRWMDDNWLPESHVGPGDTVDLLWQALSSNQYYFYMDKTPPCSFDGHILIHPNFIQAKYRKNEQE